MSCGSGELAGARIIPHTPYYGTVDATPHGWKDSHDSIVHADCSLAEVSIALVEVQGYVASVTSNPGHRPAFNPMSYHNGSVWPHDNAIIAAGMKRYGHDEELLRIAGALFEVATGARDFRLPDPYCGFDRSERASVVAYPVACFPQAWAAAPLLLVQAMPGISRRRPGASAE